MKQLLLIIALATLLYSCNENDTEFKRLDAFSVSPNTEYNLSDGIILKTRQVIDNRKPIGLKADWKGDAKLKLIIYIKNRTFDTAISTSYSNELMLQGYRLKLHSIYPYPEMNKSRNQRDYSIQLSLEKAD